MAAAKRKLSAREVVRCARCRRLVERTKAAQFEGRWYGPDCVLLQLGMSNLDFEESGEETQHGNDR